MQAVRTFVAIHISDKTRKALATFARELFADSGVRTIKEENLHLTLKFLGDVDIDRTGDICGLLEEAAEGTGSFTMEVRGVGAFPRVARPRIVWAGIEELTGKLEALQRRIEKALATIGIKKEKRKYHPHLTIGRVRNQAASNLADGITTAENRFFGEEHVNEVALMMSDLTPAGPIYTVLGTTRL